MGSTALQNGYALIPWQSCIENIKPKMLTFVFLAWLCVQITHPV